MFKIWRVGHEDDGYSFILTVASSSTEAIAQWRLEYAAYRKDELQSDWATEYSRIWMQGPNTVEELGHTVMLDDGGLKL
jgi:hypothetical protein